MDKGRKEGEELCEWSVSVDQWLDLFGTEKSGIKLSPQMTVSR